MANTVLGDGRNTVNVTTSKTLALSDCGTVQNVVQDGLTLTLPATTAGAVFVVRNGGFTPATDALGATSDSSVAVTIAPNASDQIAGLGFTATDNKAAINTKLTSRVGDQLILIGDGTNGWIVFNSVGIWARQA